MLACHPLGGASRRICAGVKLNWGYTGLCIEAVFMQQNVIPSGPFDGILLTNKLHASCKGRKLKMERILVTVDKDQNVFFFVFSCSKMILEFDILA